ncbi:MAG: nuclear transport factor 2 family protein [Proteobacteria bacterium]|nr:nuclear transport factor 2 family protein [Burkholderiales bacterium]MCA0309902.1 nuclear transport factor 2 family protein [Pseudomonadota bacterium]
MPRTRYRAAQVGGSADEVEVAFYEALHHGDLEQLMACWADEEDIVCVHPGGPRLVGAAAIRQAFEAMFGQGSIRATPERLRRVEAMGAAVHNVLERVDQHTAEGTRRAWVVATNVYLKTTQGWRMVLHHASPGRSEVAEVSEPAPLLH